MLTDPILNFLCSTIPSTLFMPHQMNFKLKNVFTNCSFQAVTSLHPSPCTRKFCVVRVERVAQRLFMTLNPSPLLCEEAMRLHCALVLSPEK